MNLAAILFPRKKVWKNDSIRITKKQFYKTIEDSLSVLRLFIFVFTIVRIVYSWLIFIPIFILIRCNGKHIHKWIRSLRFKKWQNRMCYSFKRHYFQLIFNCIPMMWMIFVDFVFFFHFGTLFFLFFVAVLHLFSRSVFESSDEMRWTSRISLCFV